MPAPKYFLRILFLTAIWVLRPLYIPYEIFSQTFQVEYTDIFPFQAQHVHGSSLAELPNGDVLCVWFQGSGERWADDVQIKGARLKKGEKAWSSPFVMADYPGFPDINPVIFVDPTDRLWLIWYTVLANQWETSILKFRISENYLGEGPPKWSWQEVIHPKPGGKTERGIRREDPFVGALEEKIPAYFSYLDSSGFFAKLPQGAYEGKRAYMERMAELMELAGGRDLLARGYEVDSEGKRVNKPMGYPRFRRMGWQTRNKPFFLESGRMLLPLYSDGFDFSLIAYTDDGGKSWGYSEPLFGLGPVQPALLQDEEGTLFAYMRDNGPPPQRLQYSSSFDGGVHWTIAKDSDIPNSGSAADCIQTKEGKWILVHNDTEEGRHTLAVSHSQDEGKSWELMGYLEKASPGEARAHYPAIIQASDGSIHVSYSFHTQDAEGNPRKLIRYARVEVE